MTDKSSTNRMIRKCAYILGVVATVFALAGTCSYAIERPVWKHSEFDPVAQDVGLLMADKNSNDFFYAKQQLDRIKSRIERLEKAGRRIEADDQKDLYYWQKQVRNLRAKIKIKQ